jgi:Helix-turn-helix of insertion element transposase
MNAKSELLAGRQQQAAFLLASGCTSSSVVQELKIHRATLAKWQKRPEFEAFLNQLLEHGRAAAQAKMITLSAKAASTLEKLLDTSNEKIRLATASEIMRHLSEVKIGPSRARHCEDKNRQRGGGRRGRKEARPSHDAQNYRGGLRPRPKQSIRQCR